MPITFLKTYSKILIIKSDACSNVKGFRKKGIFFNVLPYSLMRYGEHREVVLRPHCSVVAGTVTYKEGYTLHGYKEVCDETR